MRIKIDKNSSAPVYIQIFEQVKQQILSGELLPGFRLPSERKLSESLGINRSTVLNAYRELKADGLVGSHVGQGTVVLSEIEEEIDPSNQFMKEPAWNQLFSRYSNGFDSLIVKDLLTLANRKDVISFATGIASPEIGPIQVLKGIESEIIGKKNYRALLHSPTEGFFTLREAICEMMQKHGIYCEVEETMILSGSQQGIDLIARILLDPGDIAVVEEPTFFPAFQAFRAVGARVMGIPVDKNGIQIDALEQLLQRYRPKLIYTMPTFQNPTGIEMDIERRRRLIELAYKYKVIIVEDDAYGELRYDGCFMPTLKSMDSEGYVIYLSTFSKTVYSGLRLGWMVGHSKAIKRFAAAKQIMDLHSNSLSQWIIEGFIKNGINDHIDKIRKEYRFKRDKMCESLKKQDIKGLEWNVPNGGYYLWCKLPLGVSAERLVSKAAKKKVAFVPGSAFFTDGQGDEFVRLNFTFASIGDIEKGIERFCNAIKETIDDREENEDESVFEISPII